MGQSTLLAFGLVVIAIIQINAVPSPTAPVIPPTGVGACVAPATAPSTSTHPHSEYVKAAKDLKDWIVAGNLNSKGKPGLTKNGNHEGCLPAVGTGQYYEGYVPFDNAKLINRGKGTVGAKGKGKQCFSNKVLLCSGFFFISSVGGQ